MSLLAYRGYSIDLTSCQTKSGQWLSTASVHCNAGQISFTAMPYGEDGYTARGQAEEATQQFTREWIDHRGDR